MSSKAAIVAENAKVWAELRQWQTGHTTLRLHRDGVKDLEVHRIIQNNISPERRLKEAARLSVADIKADTMGLQTQLSKWKAGVHTFTPRARSRSPRRAEIIADSTSSRRAEALGYVAAHTFIRSEAETRMKAMIDERDATIAKQAKLIADLEVGKGPIGPVLQKVFYNAIMADDYLTRRLEEPRMKMPVFQYIQDVQAASNAMQTQIMFNTQNYGATIDGRSSSLAGRLMPIRLATGAGIGTLAGALGTVTCPRSSTKKPSNVKAFV